MINAQLLSFLTCADFDRLEFHLLCIEYGPQVLTEL